MHPDSEQQQPTKAVTPPAVVAFDLGKVLLDFDYHRAARNIAARGKLTEQEVRTLVDHSPLLYRFETGLMTNEQFFAEVKQATGFDGTFAEFQPIFSDIFEPIPAMIELQATLRQRGIPTYIFSNTNGLAIGHIRRRYPFFSQFDGYIFSYEQGAMKPDAKIYEALERMTGRRGAEILYLDDRADNVAGGAARGWRAILHETPEKTLSALVREGIRGI
jgi:putative hydrolase of the HAD superfamily